MTTPRPFASTQPATPWVIGNRISASRVADVPLVALWLDTGKRNSRAAASTSRSAQPSASKRSRVWLVAYANSSSRLANVARRRFTSHSISRRAAIDDTGVSSRRDRPGNQAHATEGSLSGRGTRSRIESKDLVRCVRPHGRVRDEEHVLERAARDVERAAGSEREPVGPPEHRILDERAERSIRTEREHGRMLGVGEIDVAGVVAAGPVADGLRPVVLDTARERRGGERRIAQIARRNAIEPVAVHRPVVEPIARPIERDRVDT